MSPASRSVKRLRYLCSPVFHRVRKHEARLAPIKLAIGPAVKPSVEISSDSVRKPVGGAPLNVPFVSLTNAGQRSRLANGFDEALVVDVLALASLGAQLD